MLDPLMRALSLVLDIEPGASVCTVREPLIGSQIPDVLVGIARGRRPTRDSRPLSGLECNVVALLSNSGDQDETAIQRALWMDEATTEHLVGRLVKRRVIRRLANGRLSLRSTAWAEQVELVAVEAKMKRWRDALRQAVSYREFVDRAYVVLDGNQVRVAENLCAEFLSQGVGLLLQFGPSLRLVIPAIAERRITSTRVRAAEKLLYSGKPFRRWRGNEPVEDPAVSRVEKQLARTMPPAVSAY